MVEWTVNSPHFSVGIWYLQFTQLLNRWTMIFLDDPKFISCRQIIYIWIATYRLERSWWSQDFYSGHCEADCLIRWVWKTECFFSSFCEYTRKTSRYINLKWPDKATYDWIWQVFGSINHDCVAGRPWKAKLCDIGRYDEWEIMISLATLENRLPRIVLLELWPRIKLHWQILTPVGLRLCFYHIYSESDLSMYTSKAHSSSTHTCLALVLWSCSTAPSILARYSCYRGTQYQVLGITPASKGERADANGHDSTLNIFNKFQRRRHWPNSNHVDFMWTHSQGDPFFVYALHPQTLISALYDLHLCASLYLCSPICASRCAYT